MKEVDYEWLAGNFEILRMTHPDGRVGFHMGKNFINFEGLTSIFLGYEDFEEGVSDIQRQRLIKAAIYDAAKAGPITATSLKREVSKQKSSYMRQRPCGFILVTSLSIKRPKSLRRLTFDGATFTFSDSLPLIFSKSEEKLEAQSAWKKLADDSTGFTKLRIAVRARSEFDAFEVSLRSLDYLKGIWNYAINRNIIKRHGSEFTSPINFIYPGPIHTLHMPSGKLASDVYYYDAVFPRGIRAGEIEEWNKVAETTKTIRKKLSHHPYADFMREIFVRYARSLDGNDHESSFLKTWSLLETLTAKSNNQGNDEVIKRAIFLFEGEEYHRQILNYLRSRRNATVHQGAGIPEPESLIYQLKNYVEWLISNHLNIKGYFKSPQQFGLLLSSPSDPKDLRKNIGDLRHKLWLLEKALKIQTRHDKS
jgi:hypothetical protein